MRKIQIIFFIQRGSVAVIVSPPVRLVKNYTQKEAQNVTEGTSFHREKWLTTAAINGTIKNGLKLVGIFLRSVQWKKTKKFAGKWLKSVRGKAVSWVFHESSKSPLEPTQFLQKWPLFVENGFTLKNWVLSFSWNLKKISPLESTQFLQKWPFFVGNGLTLKNWVLSFSWIFKKIAPWSQPNSYKNEPYL